MDESKKKRSKKERELKKQEGQSSECVLYNVPGFAY